ncbi:hypothetical protein CO112_01805 [Candidatus Dojkabacteria bacterium CG_4_9_14_3_um_filter_150_Dojkabacteria_WS6_41_13]|uniref:Peptidase C39 domain-containing protein n=1 Tax=Candidatus Dojkabacteria bacterium CG_4_10_14_0_2_um_filter_Dojkabacteria_WS6_41_15 TaxID=2014249 RepID=A0A2M7W1M5_9BACT|nr:MAG: hypothetical protein COX64_03525 [Candidatus Dojkabacteria bacterium CG_4_10_14_0_2_um_filter_Dojkabacteria_WS6_41_15]PJB22935.1 MAG: hypothetical protein CO112_01805 [Candidatus Dojkabacteria bacterium CG_4_9_14_3_um_filter_150_Dojkabacteria_WS6_41_13]
MKLKHFRQEHSHTCGIAAMRMLLCGLGIEISEKEYMKLVTIHSYGIFSTELVIPFINKGIKATAYTYNLPILARLNLPLGAEVKMEHLLKGLKAPSTRLVAESMKAFIEVGGKMYWQPPTLHSLQQKLQKGPALISVNTAALGDYWRHWNNGHYLVVSESDEKRSRVYDPYYEKPQGSYWVENERLIPAITVNSMRSTDYCMTLER